MSNKESEYKEMFMAEALDNFEELNNLFTELEKNTGNKKAVDAIFRITHTLKGNAMGMGFKDIAELSHVIEDVFSEIKEGNIELDSDLFNNLFKANDKLGALIDALKTDKKVSYKGISTKLKVLLKNTREAWEDNASGDAKSGKPENEDAPLAAQERKEEVVQEEQQPAVVEGEKKDAGINREEEAEQNAQEEQPKIAFSDLVQIPVRKLDSLMNLVGELIIERDSLIAANLENGRSNDFTRLQRITSDIQYGVMDVRLVQIGFMFKKFNRILRDVAHIENKKADLILEGTEIEIDRNILKNISDSMIHLVRNAVSHGIEKPEDRRKKGKPEVGKVTLKARNEKDTVIIDVEDDGNGIDPQIISKKAVEKGIVKQEFADKLTDEEKMMFIFEPGFSNAASVTEVSGRGVGMDVVKKATESIGGKITVDSQPGKGAKISLHLPSSMAVKGALLFEVNKHEYAVPLTYTEAVISLKPEEIYKIGNGLMSKYLDNTISILFLKDILCLDSLADIGKEGTLQKSYNYLEGDEKLNVLVVSYGNKFLGLVVDKLLQQKEIVEKILHPPLENIDMVSGATILGNGNVCLVLDIARIINQLFKERTGQLVKN